VAAQAGDTLNTEIAARKAALRIAMRRRRKSLDPRQRRAAARAAARRCIRCLAHDRTVAIYLSAHSELATAPLLTHLFKRKARVYAPIVRASGRMSFVPLRQISQVRPGYRGLPTPSSVAAPIPLAKLDAMIVPLLAFDAEGRRLGNGGGFYDRAVAPRPWRHRTRLIGYGYSFQRCAELPVEPWDVMLDWIITERNAIGSRHNRRPK